MHFVWSEELLTPFHLSIYLYFFISKMAAVTALFIDIFKIAARRRQVRLLDQPTDPTSAAALILYTACC
jgi:dolichyl-phosphate-mannose--protein O-mannosyl transferase